MNPILKALFLGLTLACSQIVFAADAPPPASARAEISPLKGSSVTGLVDFTETPQGLKVDFKFTGLKQGEEYGFHIHENGDCSTPEKAGAGDHSYPLASKGGTTVKSPEKYRGDLAPIVPEQDGDAAGSTVSTQISVNKKNPVLGRVIVVHGGTQDLNDKNQIRLACGSIRPLSVGLKK